MKFFEVEWTADCGGEVRHLFTIEAETYTKACLYSYMRIPEGAIVTNLREINK